MSHSRTRAARLLAGSAAALALGLAAGPAPAATTPATTPDGSLPRVTPMGRAAQIVHPATVYVQSSWSAVVSVEGIDVPLSWTDGCSGFVVDPTGYVVTAGHCVDDGAEGAERAAVQFLIDELSDGDPVQAAEWQEALDTRQLHYTVEGPRQGTRIQRRVRVVVGGGPVRFPSPSDAGTAANVVTVRPFSEGDVALLKIDADDLPVARIATRGDLQVGSEVMSVGYPLALQDDRKAKLALTNRIGSINSVDPEGQHGPGNNFYETGARLTSGLSGGPAVDTSGTVLGLASYRLGDEANFIVPSSKILEVVSGTVQNRQGKLDELYTAGLDAYYHGYYADAVAAFEQVLAINPDLRQVMELKTDAAERHARFGDRPKPAAGDSAHGDRSGVVPGGAVGAGGAVVAAIGLAAAGLWLRRRRTLATAGGPVPGPVPVLLPSGPLEGPGVGLPPAPSPRPGTPSPSPSSGPETNPIPVTGLAAPDHCPGCGADADGNAFCGRCGTRLGAAALPGGTGGAVR